MDIPDHEIYRKVDLDEPVRKTYFKPFILSLFIVYVFVFQLSSLAISAQKCEELFEMYGKKMFKKDELVYIPNESLGHTVQQSCEKLRKHVTIHMFLLYSFLFNKRSLT